MEEDTVAGYMNKSGIGSATCKLCGHFSCKIPFVRGTFHIIFIELHMLPIVVEYGVPCLSNLRHWCVAAARAHGALLQRGKYCNLCTINYCISGQSSRFSHHRSVETDPIRVSIGKSCRFLQFPIGKLRVHSSTTGNRGARRGIAQPADISRRNGHSVRIRAIHCCSHV
jgi:hypothetical protein